MQAGSSRGAVVFLTGLSGAGKTTIARALETLIQERQGRTVTVLDGDVVRPVLSQGLGFSREDRAVNIDRVAFVASEIAKHGGIAICAVIAAYADSRAQARRRVEEKGEFIEVHVSTSIEVCEARDDKGLYKKARAGAISHFSGVNDPYEIPEHPHLVVETGNENAQEAAQRIYELLVSRGILRA